MLINVLPTPPLRLLTTNFFIGLPFLVSFKPYLSVCTANYTPKTHPFKLLEEKYVLFIYLFVASTQLNNLQKTPNLTLANPIYKYINTPLSQQSTCILWQAHCLFLWLTTKKLVKHLYQQNKTLTTSTPRIPHAILV